MQSFDNVGLKRLLPLFSGTLRCLTGGRFARGGRGAGAPVAPNRRQKHLWDSSWTIPGGVTVDAIQKKAPALKTALGVDYLRVAPVPGNASQVRMVFGCNPTSAELAPATLRELVALDWQQAWADVKVIAPDGSVPEMLPGEAGYAHLATMPGVEVATFTIPNGLSMENIRRTAEGIANILSAVYLKMVVDPKDPSKVSVRYAAGDWEDPLDNLQPVLFGANVPLNLDKGPQVGWTEEGTPWRWPVSGVHTVAAAASGHGKGSWLPVAGYIPAGMFNWDILQLHRHGCTRRQLRLILTVRSLPSVLPAASCSPPPR